MPVKTSWTAACRALFCFALAAGCGDGLTGPDASQLEDAEKLWKSRRISSYRISQGWECFCSSNTVYEITVVSGVITSAVETVSRRPVADVDLTGLMTVPQMFDYARAAIRNRTLAYANYDAANGMPTFIYRDLDAKTVDDELGLRTKFLSQ